MFVLRKTKVLYCDVDRTLIMWESGDKWHPHKEHIKLLEQFHYQGHGIVVWSQGGYEWAEKAVKLLEIEHLVDLIINKPDWWADDKPASHVLQSENHIFLDDIQE